MAARFDVDFDLEASVRLHDEFGLVGKDISIFVSISVAIRLTMIRSGSYCSVCMASLVLLARTFQTS